MKKIKGLHFQKKLFIWIALFLLVLFGSLSVGIGFYAYRSSIAGAAALHGEIVDAGAQKIEQMIRDMDSISVQLIGNSTIQRIFQDISEEESSENYFESNLQARRELELQCGSINVAKNMVDAIYIFREPGHFFSYNTARYDNAQVKAFFASEELAEYTDYQDAYYRVVGPHTNPWAEGEETQVISLFRPLTATYYTRSEVATIEVQYRFSRLETICESPDQLNGITLTVFNRETGEIIYPQTDGNEESVKLTADREVQIIKDAAGKKYAAYSYDLELCDWSVVGIQEYDQYMNSTRAIVLLITVLCAGFCILALTGVFIVTNRMTQPIRNLREALGNVTLENITIPSEYEGNNEIELLQERFQQVLSALQKSAAQITIAQTAEYQAKIDALQAQINPHFLYNSLMSISAAGQERDALKVQYMCSQLSDLFRYASSGGSEASLGEELDNVENYLNFMKYRYLDDLEFSVTRCRRIEQIQVPKLILQPIIENCFQHGFYAVEPLFSVKIVCGVEENRWYLEITDNGGGFTEEKLREIERLKQKTDEVLSQRQHGRKVDTQNMALLNVYARLRVKYGSQVNFVIRNRAGRGAVVMIGGELDENTKQI